MLQQVRKLCQIQLASCRSIWIRERYEHFCSTAIFVCFSPDREGPPLKKRDGNGPRPCSYLGKGNIPWAYPQPDFSWLPWSWRPIGRAWGDGAFRWIYRCRLRCCNQLRRPASQVRPRRPVTLGLFAGRAEGRHPMWGRWSGSARAVYPVPQCPIGSQVRTTEREPLSSKGDWTRAIISNFVPMAVWFSSKGVWTRTTLK